MAAPDPFIATSAGTAFCDAIRVSQAGSYWFAISYNSGSGEPEVRYATTPSASWSTATIPAPTGSYLYNYSDPFAHGVVYGDSTYAFVLSYRDAGVTGTETWCIHATDPGGTWTATKINASTDLRSKDTIFADGKFVAVGGGVSTNNPWIAYCTTAGGTWTLNTTTATVGYDDAAAWTIEGIDHDGTRWVTVATGPSTDGSRYSTAIDSGWGTASGFPTTMGTGKVLRYHGGASIWVVADGLNTNYYYAADPTGTWTAIGSASTGMTDAVCDMTYGNGYWVAVGNTVPGFYDVPRVAYLAGSSPAGTYTAVSDDGLTDYPSASVRAWTAWYSGGYFVIAGTNYGEVAYCYLPTAPTFLRQRQSPVRSPSRVGWGRF